MYVPVIYLQCDITFLSCCTNSLPNNPDPFSLKRGTFVSTNADCVLIPRSRIYSRVAHRLFTSVNQSKFRSCNFSPHNPSPLNAPIGVAFPWLPVCYHFSKLQNYLLKLHVTFSACVTPSKRCPPPVVGLPHQHSKYSERKRNLSTTLAEVQKPGSFSSFVNAEIKRLDASFAQALPRTKCFRVLCYCL